MCVLSYIFFLDDKCSGDIRITLNHDPICHSFWIFLSPHLILLSGCYGEIVKKDTVDKQQSLCSFVILFEKTVQTALLCNCGTEKTMEFSTLCHFKDTQFSYYTLERLGGTINIIR